jgi:hypothetical protein
MNPPSDEWQVFFDKQPFYENSWQIPERDVPDNLEVAGPWEPFGMSEDIAAWRRPLRRKP